MGLFSNPDTAVLQDRLARLERKVDAILQHLQLDLQDKRFDAARALAASGDKIGAIKLYRELTGATLFDAKQEVESWH